MKRVFSDRLRLTIGMLITAWSLSGLAGGTEHAPGDGPVQEATRPVADKDVPYPGVAYGRATLIKVFPDREGVISKAAVTQAMPIGSFSGVIINGCLLSADHNLKSLEDGKSIVFQVGSQYALVDQGSIRRLNGANPDTDLFVAKLSARLPNAFNSQVLSETPIAVDKIKEAFTPDFDNAGGQGIEAIAVGFGGSPKVTEAEIALLADRDPKKIEQRFELFTSLGARPGIQRDGAVRIVGTEKQFKKFLTTLIEPGEQKPADAKENGNDKSGVAAAFADIMVGEINQLIKSSRGELALVVDPQKRPIIKGDSGGALFVKDAKGHLQLVGIASRYDQTSHLMKPMAFFAPIAPNYEWIKKQLQELGCW